MGRMAMAVVLLLVCALGAVCVTRADTGSGFPVPSYYVFGDGYFDAGNNNFIKSYVPRANMRPYGMTSFKRPTGRFSDGRIFADLLAVIMKLPQAPPSLSNVTDDQKATCINYASGGSAIFPGSSAAYGAKNAFTFEQQLTQYEGHAVDVIYTFGVDQALLILNDAIYQVNFGTVDILAFFTKPAYATTAGPIQTFLEALAAEYRRMVDRLYSQGARKIVVFGVGPIQKSPHALLLISKMSPLAATQFCKDVDSGVRQLNQKLVLMVTQLNNDSALDQPHASLQLVFADVYGAVLDITNKPSTYGLADVTNACCGGGKFGVEVKCGRAGAKVCNAVSKALYWNDKEFTEAANKQLFNLFFEGSRFVKPFSVKQLAKLLIPGVPY